MSKKKMSIIYVLRILKTCSSYDYPISQSLLTRAINLAGIKCDRKTIARDIDCLIECGYKIIKYKGGGCYLYDENEFLDEDIDTLEYIIKSCNLEENEKNKLLSKIKTLKKETGITSPKKGSAAYFEKIKEYLNQKEEFCDNFDTFAENDFYD